MDRMYQSKPIFTLNDADITIPSTMYRMQPLLTPALHSSSAPAGSREQQLEKRQIAILDQLKQLQAKLDTLTGTASKAGKHGQVQPDNSAANPVPAKVDAVVDTPIAQPALATAMVTCILASQGKTVTTRRYWHSTAGPVPDGFRDNQSTEQTKQADLRVNFVFKEISQASLRVSAATHAAIVGDANAARFLCRSNRCCSVLSSIGPWKSHNRYRLQQLYPTDALKAAMVDESIDATCNLANVTSKELKGALKGANIALGANPYLAGKAMSLADITLWAGIRNAGKPSLGSNVKAWFKTMESMPEAQQAVSMLSA
eukprot:m.45101 g.45101  ORF g.45101 m.45101 type:complete len:315 (+) comp13072_c0_seq1:33-977(+)